MRVTTLFFEDLEAGKVWASGAYALSGREIVEFAQRWDPAPFHVDAERARHSVFGGLTACTAHIFAIQCRLSYEFDERIELLAGLASEGFELLHPVRPGDRVRLEQRILSKRASSTKPDRGIVRVEMKLLNQNDVPVFRAVGKMLVARGAGAAPAETSDPKGDRPCTSR